MVQRQFLIISLALGLSANAEETMDFDAIVSDLKGSTGHRLAPYDPLSSVKIYAGLGISTGHLNLHFENGESADGFLTGIEGNLGIDILNPSWLAEGSFRAFDPGRIGSDGNASLREFDLKILYVEQLNRRVNFKVGGGIAARYLHIRSPSASVQEYSTPSSILLLRLGFRASQIFQVALDGSMRNSIIDETIDRSGFNLGLRLDAEF
jgi:hypothetical protein